MGRQAERQPAQHRQRRLLLPCKPADPCPAKSQLEAEDQGDLGQRNPEPGQHILKSLLAAL